MDPFINNVILGELILRRDKEKHFQKTGASPMRDVRILWKCFDEGAGQKQPPNITLFMKGSICAES